MIPCAVSERRQAYCYETNSTNKCEKPNGFEFCCVRLAAVVWQRHTTEARSVSAMNFMNFQSCRWVGYVVYALYRCARWVPCYIHTTDTLYLRILKDILYFENLYFVRVDGLNDGSRASEGAIPTTHELIE